MVRWSRCSSQENNRGSPKMRNMDAVRKYIQVVGSRTEDARVKRGPVPPNLEFLPVIGCSSHLKLRLTLKVSKLHVLKISLKLVCGFMIYCSNTTDKQTWRHKQKHDYLVAFGSEQ